MREVSCRTLGVLLKAAKRRNVPGEILTAGTEYDLAHLTNTRNRVDWDAWCRILKNARSVWSLQELSDLNEAFMRSPFFAYVGVVARLLFTSRDLFDFICKRQVGAGAQLFSGCVKPSFEHVGSDVTVIRLAIQEPYQSSPEFFWMTRGAFISMPRLVNAGSADVEMSIDGRVGTFHVRYRNKRGTLSSLVRVVSWPFTVRAAARELQRANEELQERFYELEDARGTLEQQAMQLRTAHLINELVRRDLDLATSLRAIVGVLVGDGGFASAELRLVDEGKVATSSAEEAEPPLRRTLEGRGGRVIAELAVAAKSGSDPKERNELLEFVTPTIATVLENAIYRVGLERLVEVRTEELGATVVQLREAQSARERFFANISHEIRTPLSIILLAASDIDARAGKLLDPRARSGLGAIADSARKMVRLVDELLLLAAGQEGKLQLKPEPTNLSALIESLVAAWRPMAEAAGLELRASVQPGLSLRIDPVAIERVVTNLVSNAVKYTPTSGSIDLELTRDVHGVRIAVKDTGTGIDDDLAKRLFGRFERAKDNERRVSGTGLGLSLAKQLVEAHEGTIEVIPRASGGTEFRVQLPGSLVIATSVPLAVRSGDVLVDSGRTAVGESSRTIPSKGLSTATILLAEDDVALAEMIGRVLAEEYTVVIAHDGITALELVKKHQPQLLVTDVDMPGMDGIELSKRFREATNDRLAPIIILSAVIDLGTRVAGLDAGATDYVTKPFDPLELTARVRAQLRMRDLAVRLHRAEQMSSLGVLTSGLAHELRNPANGVVNAIGPLLRILPAELRDPEHPVAQLLDVVDGCAKQIGVLSRQLLGFRSGELKLDLRPIGATELVQRAVSVSNSALTGIVLKTDIQVSVPVQCAPPLLVQVLGNLIENAAHAVGRGGWIEVAARVAGNSVLLEVGDSGAGVPVELRQRVFEPFFTTKAPGVGTGLGLSVSRDIVHRHGGVLEIRERNGRAVFVVELPLHSGVDATATAV